MPCDFLLSISMKLVAYHVQDGTFVSQRYEEKWRCFGRSFIPTCMI